MARFVTAEDAGGRPTSGPGVTVGCASWIASHYGQPYVWIDGLFVSATNELDLVQTIDDQLCNSWVRRTSRLDFVNGEHDEWRYV